jgi:rhodanese-related sulfurtransferase
VQKLRSTILEAVLLLCLGIVLALAANQLSPRGLALQRDYFGRNQVSAPSTTANNAPPDPGAVPGSVDTGLRERLAAKGLGLIEGAAVEALFRDPQYEQELTVFVDARDDRHYEEGHIPGAFQFDRYYPERYLPTVLPACLNAAKIVVYCTGGKCEDSEFAASALVEAGIPPDRIAVYEGGISDWVAAQRPVEIGARKSGTLKELSK